MAPQPHHTLSIFSILGLLGATESALQLLPKEAQATETITKSITAYTDPTTLPQISPPDSQLADGATPFSEAETEIEDTINEWTGKMGDDLSRSNYGLSHNFSTMIWDGLESILIEQTTTPTSSHEIRATRKIFDNHNSENTYSVADRFNIQINTSLFGRGITRGDAAAGELFSALGINLGGTGGLEILDIRQINTAGMHSLSKIKKVQTEINSTNWANSLGQNQARPSSSDVLILSESRPEDQGALSSLAAADPLHEARYSDYFNLLNSPFHIPFTSEGLKDLQNGEVMAYNLNGSIQLNAGIGWTKNLPTYFHLAEASLNYSVYLRGEYRVAVLKEDDTHARVKITRTRTRGKDRGFNSDGVSQNYYNGFLFFGRVVDQKHFTVVPFRLNSSSSEADVFDLGFRYDLTSPQAQKAYQLAMLGRYAYSDQLAEAKNQGVEKLFSRDQTIANDSFSTGLNLAQFYVINDLSSTVDSNEKTTLPNGTHRFITTDTQNLHEWKTFFGIYRRNFYDFRVSIDLDRFERGDQDALFLVAEGIFENSNTSGNQLDNYAVRVEEAAGVQNLFPRLPVSRPLNSAEEATRNQEAQDGIPAPLFGDLPLADYGPSTFYFRTLYNQAQVTQFMEYPEEKMWSVLEKAFEINPGDWSSTSSRMAYLATHSLGMLANAPLYFLNLRLHDSPKLYYAYSIESNWRELQKAQSVNQKAAILSKLFSQQPYGRELVRLLRIVLNGEAIPYTASATNDTFGRIYRQSTSSGDFISPIERINRKIDFDVPESKIPTEDLAQVVQLELKVIPQGHRLRFTTNVKPHALFVRLVEDGGWTSNKICAEFSINNPGYLKQGENTLFITEKTGEPWATLAKKMEKGKQYQLSIAISGDGERWGPLSHYTHFISTY